MDNTLLEATLNYQAFEILNKMLQYMKEDPLFNTLQLTEAYSSQDQEYEKNEFYGDSFLEVKASSLIMYFMNKFDHIIPIEIYSDLRIHTVKNDTLGAIFEKLHLGDKKIFERKSLTLKSLIIYSHL